MEGVPEVLRGGVLAFLKAHQLEAPHELAAAAPEDLTHAFAQEPPEFTLGHRAVVRRLREAARRLPPPPPPPPSLPSSFAALAQPALWLGPSLVRALAAWGELQRRVPGLFVSVATVFLVCILGEAAKHTGLWSHLTEWDTRCSHEPLPGGNDTGIKFLIATVSQSGARTLSQSLHRVGVEQSFQGVDLAALVWSGLYDDYHRRPQQGGQRYNSDHLWSRFRQDNQMKPSAKMLLNLPPAELASAVSRCRIEALSFTGMESLFWPIYRMSPQAKVIFVHPPWEVPVPLDEDFLNPNFAWTTPLFILLSGANHMLPWGALLHLADPAAGGQIRSRLANGGPPLTQDWGPFIALWYRAVSQRRVMAHRTAGLHWLPRSFHDADSFGANVFREVPKSRLKEWQLEKNEWQELCDLVNATSCRLKGPLRTLRNVPDFNFDDVFTFWVLLPLNILIVWLDALFLKYAWKLISMPLEAVMEVPGLRTVKAGALRLRGGFSMLTKLAVAFVLVRYYNFVSERVDLVSQGFRLTSDGGFSFGGR